MSKVGEISPSLSAHQYHARVTLFPDVSTPLHSIPGLNFDSLLLRSIHRIRINPIIIVPLYLQPGQITNAFTLYYVHCAGEGSHPRIPAPVAAASLTNQLSSEAMDTFAWSGPGHHDDVYLTRQLSCGRFDLDDVFLRQLQSDVGGIDFAGGGTTPCQVSSTYGAVGHSATTGPLGFFGSGPGVDVFSSVVDGASAHDGLLDSALSFSKVLACGGEGDPAGAVSNGAMFSGYSGTTVCNISSGDSNNNYSGGGGHDVTEVASPTSTISPTTTSHPTITSAAQALHHPNRKLPADDCPAILTAPPLPRAGAKRKAPTCTTTATSITFGKDSHAGAPGGYEPDMEAMAQVKEMIYRAAAMRPVNLITDTEAPAAGSSKPRRKNVRISSDPQTVAARLRRERVSDRLRVLQKLVPGGSKMDTASMLDEAASYLKFLKSQVQALETLGTSSTGTTAAASTARLQQHYYGNSPGFLGFSRNNTNISAFRNPNGNSTKLL